MSNSLIGHHERLINPMEKMRSKVKRTAGNLAPHPFQKYTFGACMLVMMSLRLSVTFDQWLCP
jgi:hypothetical protein